MFNNWKQKLIIKINNYLIKPKNQIANSNSSSKVKNFKYLKRQNQLFIMKIAIIN